MRCCHLKLCHSNDVAIIYDWALAFHWFIGPVIFHWSIDSRVKITFGQNWSEMTVLSVDYLLKWQWRKWNANLSNRTEFQLTGWYYVFINWVFLWKLNTHQRLSFELGQKDQVSLKIYRLENFSDSKNDMFSYIQVLKITKNIEPIKFQRRAT